MKHSIKNNDTHKRIIKAQVSYLYSVLPVSQATTVVNSIVIYFIQRPHVDSSTARYWLWTLLAVVALRLSLYLLYRFPQQEYLERDNEIWKQLFTSTAIACAVIWGSAGIFLFPEDNIRHQVFLVFVIAGMAIASIATLFSDKNTAIIFIVTLITPITIQFAILPDAMAKIMAFMLLMSIASAFVLIPCINRQFIENVKLSVEAKHREIESLQYSSLLIQTQKMANIAGWEADIEKNYIRLSPEFNSIFKHLSDYEQQITNAILNAVKESASFDFELALSTPNTTRKHWVRIIGGIRINNSDLLHGAIQDISNTKTMQLDLNQPRKQAIDYTKKWHIK